MPLPTCEQLREAYFELLLTNVKEVEVGDKVVKYQDIRKLQQLIEDHCGPIYLEGANTEKRIPWSVHKAEFNRPSESGCCEGCEESFRECC